MPTNVVKTKSDEKKWSKAKALAKKEGKEDNYAYIMSIYKNLKGESDKSSEIIQALNIIGVTK